MLRLSQIEPLFRYDGVSAIKMQKIAATQARAGTPPEELE